VKDFFNKTITLNLLFCLSYCLLATLGFQWGALTSNATLLWPPSGLAVFGFIIFGRRVLPGFLFGAIISSQTILLSTLAGNNTYSYLISAINGSASILQALIIAQVSRTYYRRDFRVKTSSAFYFTLMVLSCCIIAATVSNLTLWQSGVITLAIALQNWAVWWMGDAIGVLIVTPLLLWVYRKQTLYKNPQADAFLIFCAGIGIVFLTVAAVGHNERESYQKNLTHETENLQASIQANIDLAERDLSTLQEYFLNNSPNQEEFRNLTEPLLKRNLWLDSFSWIPTINNVDQKANLEMDFSAGLTLVRIGEMNFIWRQPERAAFPTDFLTNLNVRLAPTRSDIFLRKDLDNPQAISSPLISIATPIYFCTANKKNNCKVFNLVSSELNLDSLMRSAISRNQLKNLDIHLAITDSKNKIDYWEWNGKHWSQITEKDKSIIKASTLIKGKIPVIKVMNSEWQLLVSQKNISTWFLPSLLQIYILVIGFAMVFLLSAYLQALYRQDQLIIENQEKLKEEINIQTQALRTTNDWLLKEIEEKRTTQEQLKASEAHMRTLLDNIPDPIWFKSNEGVYLSFNKAVSTLFHRTEKEVIGKHAGDYVNPEFEAIIKDFETSVLASKQAVRRELWMHIPSKNESRLMDTIKVAVRDEHKNPTGILSIARDITEQHQLIDELEKFKRFAEYASEGFSIMSLAAETLYMNRSMQRMLLSNQKLTHNNFLNYLPQDLHEQWREQIFPYVLLNGYWQGELAALRADGSRFPTKETFFIIRDDKGQPMHLGEIMSDISEQKQIETSLQLAKEAAEDATRAKSRFLANMSHEIRTPLNAVLGYSQLLITDTQLSTQQHERMNAILNAGQRLLHLINDILDLSKIEAGALHFRQDYFDLRQELNDIIAIMRTKAITKGLALNYDIQLPIPSIVKSDRQKIGQIILNLLGNAIKFTASGEINLVVHADNNSIFFTITDTGPGIAAQELQLLFAAFKQGKSGEETGGTGLGLVISKHIAESLGGNITLDSEPGKGTRAYLRLPLMIEYNTQVDSTPLVMHAKLVKGHSCKTLVIEDDPASRDLLVNLLRNMGCEVSEAINGKEGLFHALAQKPDIIFTDIRMPELSGTEMLKELRKIFAKPDLPVIAVSASSLEHERNFYLGEGFHEFIGKPYQFRDIYSALQRFTSVQFENIESDESFENAIEYERENWHSQVELISLQRQLEILKSMLNSGDMNNSKKLFAQQSAHALGKNSYQKISNAIRQYDLVLAERFLDELLAEIENTLSALGNPTLNK
jgi:PAS domain S-box-containing protein